MTVRVLVADDHAAIRLGLVMILSGAEGIEVVGEAGDGATAVRMARALRPDVVLMDIRMPGTDGIEATRELAGDGICEVLVLTTFDLDEYVHEALRAGAAGFLLKSVEAPRLIDSIRLVAAGDGVLEPQVTRRLLRAFAATAVPARRAEILDQLTERERDVLSCLGAGLSNAQIARATVHLRGHRQDPRFPGAGQARPVLPGPGRDPRPGRRPDTQALTTLGPATHTHAGLNSTRRPSVPLHAPRSLSMATGRPGTRRRCHCREGVSP